MYFISVVHRFINLLLNNEFAKPSSPDTCPSSRTFPDYDLDAKHKLETPKDDPRLDDIIISRGLLTQKKFKLVNLDDAGDDVVESQY